MRLKYSDIFFILTLCFLAYSFSIYLAPMLDGSENRAPDLKAMEGRLVWQKHNCQSCHQLYGLGGYLGPDLTNIYSAEGKGEVVIKAMVKSGVKQMPAFTMSKLEVEDLLAFLKSVDASGKADPRTFEINKFGMINESE